jgi:hypothetical protein
MTNLNKLIVSIPADKLVISEEGRLDYPKNIATCSGIKTNITGETSKECLCCLNYLNYFRRFYHEDTWDNRRDSFICIKTPKTITVDYRYIDYFASSVDKLSENNYTKHILPVLEKLYGELT